MRRVLKAVSPFAFLLAAVVGAQAQTVLTTINYPTGVNGVAVDYIADRAYVLLPNYSNGANAVQVLDTKDNAVLTTFPSAGVANAIAVNPITGVVYVAGAVPSTTNPSGIESVIVAFNPNTGAVVATIPITATAGYGIVALAVDPLNDRIYASDASDNALVVINGRSHRVRESVPLNGQTPAGLAVKGMIKARRMTAHRVCRTQARFRHKQCLGMRRHQPLWRNECRCSKDGRDAAPVQFVKKRAQPAKVEYARTGLQIAPARLSHPDHVHVRVLQQRQQALCLPGARNVGIDVRSE